MAMLVFTLGLQAQLNPVFFKVFDSDSLQGFNENDARTQAISEGFLGQEYKVKMYYLKREYINAKYGLSREQQVTNLWTPIQSSRPSTVQACLNDDFENSAAGYVNSSSQIAGWTLMQGYNGYVSASSAPSLTAAFPNGLTNANSCNLFGCCPFQPSASEIIDCGVPGGYIDPVIGVQYPVFSIFGTGTVSGAAGSNTQIPQGLFGTKVLRLNDGIVGDYGISKLSKTFLVSSSNTFYEFAFIGVFAPGHSCCDAGAFQVNAYTNGTSPAGNPTLLACPSTTLAVPSSACSSTLNIPFYVSNSWTPHNTSNFANVYTPWNIKSVDLSNYIGQYVTLDVIVSDCTAGGHFGYVYFDARCGSTNIDTSSAGTCAPSVTLTAPSGFASYQWTGPSGFSSSNVVISPTVSGTYSLLINSPGLCAAVQKTVSVSIANPFANISSSDSLICKGEPVILTAQNMYNCVWSTGDLTPSVFLLPDSTVSYAVTGVTPEGCPVSATYVQHVEECASVGDSHAIAQFRAFPNPNSGEFELVLGTKPHKTELVIINVLGQEVHRQTLKEVRSTVKVKHLNAGLYYYTVLTNKRSTYKGKLEIK